MEKFNPSTDKGPILGEYASMIYGSDRYAYKVVEIVKNKIKLQKCDMQCTDYYAQKYTYKGELPGTPVTLVFRWGHWRYELSNGAVKLMFTTTPNEHQNPEF